jgi:hypothetical protein
MLRKTRSKSGAKAISCAKAPIRNSLLGQFRPRIRAAAIVADAGWMKMLKEF